MTFGTLGGVKRKSIPRPTVKQIAMAAGLVAIGAAGITVWGWTKPRTLGVCVVTDYSYRQQRPQWQEFLNRRFTEANRIFRGTGVQWNFRHADEPDPTGRIQGMEDRRQRLIRTQCQADLILLVTGRPESNASGNVPAFAHTAIVVDNPKLPDQLNDRVFAQGLALLFGAPVDARGAGTLLTQPPESDQMPKAAAKLIGRLRDYDFEHGTAGLEGAGSERVLDALTAAHTGRGGNAQCAAHRTMAMALAADQNLPAAVRHLQEAVKIQPNQASAHIELATMFSHNFQHREAAEAYRGALKVEPNSAKNHAGLAVALANAGRGEEAIEEFQAALRIDPKFTTAQAGMAYILSQELGRIDEAIAAYRVAVEMNPSVAAASQGLARAEGFKEKALAAAAAQRTRAQAAPGSASAQFDLGLAEARAGNVEPAVRAFRRALELDGRNGQAQANLAILLYLQKDYQGARRAAEAAKLAGFEAPSALVESIRKKTAQ